MLCFSVIADLGVFLKELIGRSTSISIKIETRGEGMFRAKSSSPQRGRHANFCIRIGTA